MAPKKHTARGWTGSADGRGDRQGAGVASVRSLLDVMEVTFFRWRKQRRGMRVDQAKRFKVLERENARLKRLLAETELTR